MPNLEKHLMEVQRGGKTDYNSDVIVQGIQEI